MMVHDVSGAIGGIRVDRGNLGTRRGTAPVPHFPPQIPHKLTQAGTQAEVGSQRLTAWAMARSFSGEQLKSPHFLTAV
jgi:hypothetical protein